MEKRALLLISVGEKYQTQLRYKLGMISEYAKKCHATLIVRTEPLDPTGHRSILSQKMLIPSSYPDFDVIAFLDLDIHIATGAPDIFEELSDDVGFSGVLDPRGSEGYIRTWKKFPNVLAETTISYFVSRGFAENDALLGSINGGVLLFRPPRIKNLFFEYYWSNETQKGIGDGNEEAPLAYMSQTAGLFSALDQRYNQQFIYSWVGTLDGDKFEAAVMKIRKSFVYKILAKTTGIDLLSIPKKIRYARHIRRRLGGAFIVHMAGGFETMFRVKF